MTATGGGMASVQGARYTTCPRRAAVSGAMPIRNGQSAQPLDVQLTRVSTSLLSSRTWRDGVAVQGRRFSVGTSRESPETAH